MNTKLFPFSCSVTEMAFLSILYGLSLLVSATFITKEW